MRLKKKLLVIMVCFALVLSLMPGMGLTAYAASETTVTYDLSVDGKSISKDGVTCTEKFGSTNNIIHGGTFTTSNGKFTKIVVNANDSKYVGRNAMDMSSIEGWSSSHSSATWTGNSSSVQFGIIMGNGNNVTITFTIEPSIDVTGVSLNKTTTTLTVGDTETLTATVNPDNATDKTITWSSDNESVATVSDGVITAVAAGTATITVTATNGTEDTSDDKTATCEVKVNAASSGGDSSDSGSGSSSGGSSDSGNISGGTSSGSSDNTNTNTDTSAKVTYDDVAISTGSVNDITGTESATAESNPFETKIENNDNLTTLLALTDEEVAQGVNVWLDIQDMSDSVQQTDKTLVQNTSGDYTVGLYFDINLFKKVGSNDATKVTETNGKVQASIVIPESLRKSGRTFEIIRVHDGVATAITGTYDENTHVFTFETDKFSTYALAYKDSASSSDSSNNTQSSTPETGDPNDIRVWYLLLIASLGGLGFLGCSKKKKVND